MPDIKMPTKYAPWTALLMGGFIIYTMSTKTAKLVRYAVDKKTCTHLFLMPTNPYTTPVRSRNTPPTDSAGVIRGVSGSASVPSITEAVPLVGALLVAVDVIARVDVVPSSTVDEGVPDVVLWSTILFPEIFVVVVGLAVGLALSEDIRD